MKLSELAPISARLSPCAPAWAGAIQERDLVDAGGMQLPDRFAEQDARHVAIAGIADVSCFRRCGLKGGAAAAWLEAQGMPVPPAPNSASSTEGGTTVLRLARSEFLIEDGPRATVAARLTEALGRGTTGVYPVLRHDAGLLLSGERVLDLLARTCSVNFRALDAALRPVVMTLVAGISVILLPPSPERLEPWRLWCDASFAPCLWEALTEVAAELGGGPVGLAATGIHLSNERVPAS